MQRSRRNFLNVGLGAAATAVVDFVSPIFPVRGQADSTFPSSVPDAGGFTKPVGWGLCLGKDTWEAYGLWVPAVTLELFKPQAWHHWASWPEYYGHGGGIPMVWSSEWFVPDMVRRRMAAHPREIWQITNEPDHPQQAHETPRQTVDTTLALIELGRETGNEFQIMSPAITVDTSYNGLAWLTEFVRIMRREKCFMVPPYWAIHPYTSTDVPTLRETMRKWWEWYAAWGHDAPVVITEGCAEDRDVNAHKRIMDEFRRMLDDGEVQGVMWFQAYRMVDDRRLDAKLSPETRAWSEAQRRRQAIPWDHYHLGVLHPETQEIDLTDLGRHWKSLQ